MGRDWDFLGGLVMIVGGPKEKLGAGFVPFQRNTSPQSSFEYSSGTALIVCSVKKWPSMLLGGGGGEKAENKADRHTLKQLRTLNRRRLIGCVSLV